ncbi:hypothetical protein CQ393_04170 [Stenotrophomonas sp. MYb238]|uniref:hypothetical protein n=1 Tax=Stenotrophomonas sp. MYb238 TaxID=2040281 RepID=UPI0012911E6F|nr:hypothetical protein [Stenotrophomonas sp. MYb238]MQP75091.1 hypothetical protein [Stenotrophomonas sp. MYb238]
MNAPRERLQSRHWFGKTMAGLVLGYALAVALSGVIALLTPGGLGGEGKIQFNMWMIPPLWATVLGFVFLFRDGRRAWSWLGLATVAAFGLLWALKAWLG